MSTSRIRQNFHAECEAGINKQINMELYASYVYLSMAYFFDREDVALKGFHKFFKKSSDEEREHAQKFINYQQKRGGRVVLQPIDKPSLDEWGTGLAAMEAALELEKTVNQALLDLHAVATGKNDPQMCDFLENEFLGEQVEAAKQLSDYISNLKRVGPGLGEYMFDKETLKGDE
jgi:ferritin heavy chain